MNFFKKAKERIHEVHEKVKAKVVAVIVDPVGELATDSIGAIIIVVVIVGLAVVAIKKFFPGFFTTMFNSAQAKLNLNW